MSFLVCHVEKFKASDARGLQIHNQRESDNSKNRDIDYKRTSQNYDIHNDENINYTNTIKERLNDTLGTSKPRKDAVLMVEVLVSSDKEFFDKLQPEQQKEFFQKSYDYIAERYGKENIIAASVHMDEKTPHLHLDLVPITRDKRLCAKELFDRKNLLEIQRELPEHLQKQGFNIQRGQSTDEKRKHIEIHEFKRQTSLEQANTKFQEQVLKVKDSQEQLRVKLQEDKARLDADKLNFEQQKARLDTEKAAYLKENLPIEHLSQISKRAKTTGFFSKTVELDPTDYEMILKYAKKGAVANSQLREMEYELRQHKEHINHYTVSLEKYNQVLVDGKRAKEKLDKIYEKYPNIKNEIETQKRQQSKEKSRGLGIGD